MNNESRSGSSRLETRKTNARNCAVISKTRHGVVVEATVDVER